MGIVNLNQKLKRVEISQFEIENDIVFNYIDSLKASERDDKLTRALYIGVLALMEDRLSSFLAKTSNELGTQLESLKMIFDMKQELFFKSAVKGIMAEEDIASFLKDFFKESKVSDKVFLTGNEEGVLKRNKTGDIVCLVNGSDDLKIVVECKFDKSIRLGDISTKDVFTKSSDTVWSQLIEAEANRSGKVSLLVLDYSLVDSHVLNIVKNVKYIPEVGFVAIVDSQKGDYSNLGIAYMLARDIAVNARPRDYDKNLLDIIVNRIAKETSEILKVKSMVHANIENNKKILQQLEKSILMVAFSHEYLSKFLEEGTLSKEDLLKFYAGDDVSEKYSIIEKEIRGI